MTIGCCGELQNVNPVPLRTVSRRASRCSGASDVLGGGDGPDSGCSSTGQLGLCAPDVLPERSPDHLGDRDILGFRALRSRRSERWVQADGFD